MKNNYFLFLIVTIPLLIFGCGAKEYQAGEVVSSIKECGIPISSIQVFSEKDDPNELLGRPGQYITKANFADSRIQDEDLNINGISVTDGGSIETFSNKEDATRRYKYISELAKTSLFSEYDFLINTVLLRVSRHFTPDEAEKYKDCLMKAVK